MTHCESVPVVRRCTAPPIDCNGDSPVSVRFSPARFSQEEASMQLNVTGHHIDITASLKGYVEKRFDRIERHSDHIIDVRCILTVEKLRHKAEATVLLNGAKVYADAVDQDMYAAIDALADKLDRGVKKHKEKLSDHHASEAGKSWNL
jgi:putative sigma-54 modulation protein